MIFPGLFRSYLRFLCCFPRSSLFSKPLARSLALDGDHQSLLAWRAKGRTVASRHMAMGQKDAGPLGVLHRWLGLCFLLPIESFGYPFLTHSHIGTVLFTVPMYSYACKQ